MVLRYFLIIATYYTLAKDYFTISQLFTILFTRRRCDRRVFYFLMIIIFRSVILAYSEVIIIMIICTTDLASSLGIGLILNFTAGVITCEIDDMAMKTQVAQSMVQQYGESFLKFTVKRKHLPQNLGSVYCFNRPARKVRDFLDYMGAFFTIKPTEEDSVKPAKFKVSILTFHKLLLTTAMIYCLIRDLAGFSFYSE